MKTAMLVAALGMDRPPYLLLFPAGPLHFNADWQAGGPVQLGQAMATTNEQDGA